MAFLLVSNKNYKRSVMESGRQEICPPLPEGPSSEGGPKGSGGSPSCEPSTSQGICSQGVFRPSLGVPLQDMGVPVLSKVGRRPQMEPLKRFEVMVKEHLDGILSYCEKKVPLGYIESTNQKAKNVIRRVYGYRNERVKKLKIIQACTPWMNNFEPWRHAP